MPGSIPAAECMVAGVAEGHLMKWCHKCGRLILAGEEYESYDKVSASAAGMTVHLHVVCPPKTGTAVRH